MTKLEQILKDVRESSSLEDRILIPWLLAATTDGYVFRALVNVTWEGKHPHARRVYSSSNALKILSRGVRNYKLLERKSPPNFPGVNVPRDDM